MNDLEISAPNADAAATAGEGFQVAERPQVGAPARAAGNGLPVSYGNDLLYAIARDPGTLFLYWDVNWERLFAQAGLAAREVHLRIYRKDGSVETTRAINPFRGHCYVEVSNGGADYYGELGCFNGPTWIQLARSGTTATPEAAMSEDFSAEFATLPLHLSFQRLLEVFEKTNPKSLAHSVAELQGNGQTATSADAAKGGNENQGSVSSALLEAARQTGPPPLVLTAAQRAQWEELVAGLSSSSWGGASERGLGGSSR